MNRSSFPLDGYSAEVAYAFIGMFWAAPSGWFALPSLSYRKRLRVLGLEALNPARCAAVTLYLLSSPGSFVSLWWRIYGRRHAWISKWFSIAWSVRTGPATVRL